MPAAVPEGKSRMLPPLPPASSPLPPGAFAEEAGRCANCLTPLAGPFCSQCGQHVADYHRSVWRFVVDFFDSAFCWDNKLLRTLDPLLKRPGWLTQEFMAGRRVRYVHPLRLFLFTSAICLTLIQFIHRDGGSHVRVRSEKEAKPAASIQVSDDKDKDDDEKASPAASAALTDKDEDDDKKASPAASAAPTAPLSSPAEVSLGQVFRDTYKPGSKNEPAAGTAGMEAAAKKMEEASKKMEAAGAKMDAAGAFREKMTTNVQQKLSWVTLAMLPIFALLMRWAYGRSGGYYFTYLVFSLHYHTFLLLFWVAYSIMDAVANRMNHALFQLPGLLVGLCLLLPPFYLYRALRQMYGQNRFATAIKVSAIGALHLFALFVGLAIIGATSFL